MKVLFVGLGSIARKHIEALHKIDSNIAVYALRRTISQNNIAGVLNIFKINQIPEDISFIIISNPTLKHKETIINLINLRKPFFIEKPVLANIDGASELALQIKKKGILTYVACNLRFHPAIQLLSKELKNRIPIEFTTYCGSYLPDWRPNLDYRKIYSSKIEMGGGVHLDLIHELDYCLFLFGLPKKTFTFTAKKSSLEINSKDIAHYVLEYERLTAFITLNYYRKDSKRSIDCVWEDESWFIDLISNKIINNKSEIIHSGDYHISDTYLSQMKYFIHSIESNIQPMNSFENGIETLKIALHERSEL